MSHLDRTTRAVREQLLDFDWSNYRLDDVEQAESSDWADALAGKIALALAQAEPEDDGRAVRGRRISRGMAAAREQKNQDEFGANE